mmetsp:Transcript_50744/g.114078  ORF Transcript_50744/g.114078 Transcript_50744/m.114078 type:complete len:208 (-) Transcript_50744:3-626(-)
MRKWSCGKGCARCQSDGPAAALSYTIMTEAGSGHGRVTRTEAGCILLAVLSTLQLRLRCCNPAARLLSWCAHCSEDLRGLSRDLLEREEQCQGRRMHQTQPGQTYRYLHPTSENVICQGLVVAAAVTLYRPTLNITFHTCFSSQALEGVVEIQQGFELFNRIAPKCPRSLKLHLFDLLPALPEGFACLLLCSGSRNQCVHGRRLRLH